MNTIAVASGCASACAVTPCCISAALIGARAETDVGRVLTFSTWSGALAGIMEARVALSVAAPNLITARAAYTRRSCPSEWSIWTTTRARRRKPESLRCRFFRWIARIPGCGPKGAHGRYGRQETEGRHWTMTRPGLAQQVFAQPGFAQPGCSAGKMFPIWKHHGRNC